jgi:hypothetical protein
MTGDDELFEELQRLVTPEHREPPIESVVALHAAVARNFSARRKRPWWRQKIAVGAAVFGLVAGAPAAAFALSGTPLPSPLRTAVHDIGLPVDSVPVADTKAAEDELAHALRDRNEAEITKAAAHLEACLAELNPADRARLDPRADTLLQVAASIEGGDAVQGISGEPEPDGTSRSGGDPHSGSALPSGPSASSIQDSTDRSGGADDGGLGGDIHSAPTTTIPGGTLSGDGSDGDRTASTTTLAPAATQTDGDSATTTTTAQSSGGGSDSISGGTSVGGDSTPTTTGDQSH